MAKLKKRLEPVPPGTRHIRVQLSEEQQAKLRIAAAQSGMSMAAYARAILVEAIDGSKR
jgi:plasmid stability protein